MVAFAHFCRDSILGSLFRHLSFVFQVIAFWLCSCLSTAATLTVSGASMACLSHPPPILSSAVSAPQVAFVLPRSAAFLLLLCFSVALSGPLFSSTSKCSDGSALDFSFPTSLLSSDEFIHFCGFSYHLLDGQSQTHSLP